MENELDLVDKLAKNFLIDLYLKINEHIDRKNITPDDFCAGVDSYMWRYYDLKSGRSNPTIRSIIKLASAIGKKIVIT